MTKCTFTRIFVVFSTRVETWLNRGQFHKLFCALTPNFCTLRPTFEKLFTGAKVWCKAQKMGVGHKAVYKIDIEKKIQFLY